jgi:carbonic anhydrase
MEDISVLLQNNQAWSERMRAAEPGFFERLASQQAPKYLWIGCSDSRVPANEVVDLAPGELFVHRNVGNLVYPADLNCLSVVQYAVNVLKVEHIIVVGHYQCGGVKAALDNTSHGLIDNWLTKIKDLYVRYREDIDSLLTQEMRVDRMCELNVIEQVRSLSFTTIIQDAWARQQKLMIHGWIYGLKNGLVNVLPVRIEGIDQVPRPYRFLHKMANADANEIEE